MKDYLKVLRNYATFSGRATRREYWTFMLLSMVIYLSLILLPMSEIQVLSTVCAWCGLFYSVIIIIPMTSVSVRRLHDTGRNGWWYFINLIPYIGFVVFLVFMLQKSDVGPNDYDRIPCLSYKKD